MSRKNAPNAYGFTTTPTDPFIQRVIEEAKPSDLFLVTSAVKVDTRDQFLYVAIHKDALPPKSAGFDLFDTTLSKTGWGTAIGDYRVETFEATNLKKAVNISKSVLQRVKNYLQGRTVRVFVESF